MKAIIVRQTGQRAYSYNRGRHKRSFGRNYSLYDVGMRARSRRTDWGEHLVTSAGDQTRYVKLAGDTHTHTVYVSSLCC